MVDRNMLNEIKTLQQKYNKFGTVLIQPKSKSNILSEKDFRDLENYCKKVKKEIIKIGDAGEKNHLHVGRFMTDIKKPLVVKNPYSKKVLKILYKKEYIDLVKKVLGIKSNKKVFLRRIQFNQIDKGNFVGYHLDTDSNPDYQAAVVIQLGRSFSGGKYRVYQNKKSYIDYSPKQKSIIISNCEYPHEVTKVTKGNRKSLVFFIGKNLNRNKRKK
jgi:Rps23 Pro-64 3,4-dihydroxylase Tpa1-like proline 4-hydroxylase